MPDDADRPAIIPVPTRTRPRPGTLRLDRGLSLRVEPEAALAGALLREALAPLTGPGSGDGPGGDPAPVTVRVDPRRAREHGYTLTVDTDRVEIVGADPVGAFHGAQTLRQLLPARLWRGGSARGAGIPCTRVEDHPRLRWRGLMLDVARHFLPKDFVLRLIDLLALHKLNVLHLHLTDDQGWRIEVPGYPRLTEVGAWRARTVVGNDLGTSPDPVYDRTPHGGYYTEADLREIVAHARDRCVEVVPEIDMPGHMQAAIAAYPELGNTGAPTIVRERWGVGTRLLNVDETALRFCRDVLTHVMDVFPGRYVHCGGDEVPKDEWRDSPRAQEHIRRLGLADEEELQGWFTGYVAAFLAEHGRTLVGWDEVLDGGALPADVTVMAWRERERGEAAARLGHETVMAPTSHVYLDYYQDGDTAAEPLAFGGGFVPLSTAFDFEPVPAALDGEVARRVVGAEAQMWTEYVATEEHTEYMLFPRLCAFAEAVWRQPDERGHDRADFLARLRVHLERLEALGVGYRPLDGRNDP
ncbi:beta-N-acetylhexosaminidase [Nocardiopsis sp. HUAS JQ3]|uniref:beta-N-acetylhexosaminidase n=1 Tax=Nocardiopsis sp. HUAS JQ3 TaxID=3061629 RepID=UPI0023A9321D|nr:beta-N-acetylhexosaminidase [Nocardiopsis sp. HUAS JQ3]WDZ88523.1 beta-N-acetylhexosaminidase [Nocardiopsis sp. HUAS JQ3]